MLKAKFMSGGLALFAGVVGFSVRAETVEEFYRGRRITMYIGSSSAGGTDVYGRIVANFMGAHLPGNPQFVVSNVPGATGLVLANQLANTLPKDGTAIASIDRYLPIQAILGNPAVKFDPRTLNWIGSTNVDVSTCVVWHTSGVTTLQEFISRDLAIGSTAVYTPNILNRMFGAHLKLIAGYPGGNDINLAMERGELQGRCHWSWSSIISGQADWIRDKKIKVIVQFTGKKHADMPDVPLITELARTDRDREIMAMILSAQEMARPFVAPPGIPPERIAALRNAFDATLNDPAFLRVAKAQDLELQPVTGIYIQDLVDRLSQTPADVVKAFSDIVMTQ